MKISTQIFLGYFLIVGISSFFLFTSFVNELRPGVRQATEETLVELSHLLAELVKDDVVHNNIHNNQITPIIHDFLKIQPNALIWKQQKNRINLRIYITDEKGIVLFDSNGPETIGEDYSQWNDVYLTLRGEYGARSTKQDASDDDSTVMYVAAPVKEKGKIIGVLAVGKPSYTVQPYITLSEYNFVKRVLALLMVSLIVGLIISLWLTRSVNKLSKYAAQVSQGKRVKLPVLREPELNQLAQSIESMRTELEGRAYVENYVHTLTHEMKSPLAAIKGAAELLREGMEAKQQEKFTQNILTESCRVQEIIERLLSLAEVEKQQSLQNIERVRLLDLVRDVVASREPAWLKKEVSIVVEINENTFIQGELFLLTQAISNLLDNAIDFCLTKGEIKISHRLHNHCHHIEIQDNGVGFPDYAADRLFERFYSLPRPDTDRKSYGLGLSFVQEVANLHGGQVSIENIASQGVRATIIIPSKSH